MYKEAQRLGLNTPNLRVAAEVANEASAVVDFLNSLLPREIFLCAWNNGNPAPIQQVYPELSIGRMVNEYFGISHEGLKAEYQAVYEAMNDKV